MDKDDQHASLSVRDWKLILSDISNIAKASKNYLVNLIIILVLVCIFVSG